MQRKGRNHTASSLEPRLQLVGRRQALPAGSGVGTLPAVPGTVESTDDESLRQHAWLNVLEASQHLSTSKVIYGLLIKRWLDVVGASLLLICLAPLLVVVTLLIRVSSPGPAIYRQQRIGKDGEPFVIYKFRTMTPDRRQRNEPISGPDRRRRHKTEHDPRVTRLGRFLRQTSIDELPQLFNVLRGEMSFIGPRPEMPKIVEQYEDWQHRRHIVRPGLSGWWQISGRSDRPMHENTELDIYYVAHQSFSLDLYIFLQTFRALFRRDGAF